MTKWAIDTSTGRPILTYESCSVIEAEQAEYVLGLIKADIDRKEHDNHSGDGNKMAEQSNRKDSGVSDHRLRTALQQIADSAYANHDLAGDIARRALAAENNEPVDARKVRGE